MRYMVFWAPFSRLDRDFPNMDAAVTMPRSWVDPEALFLQILIEDGEPRKHESPSHPGVERITWPDSVMREVSAKEILNKPGKDARVGDSGPFIVLDDEVTETLDIDFFLGSGLFVECSGGEVQHLWPGVTNAKKFGKAPYWCWNYGGDTPLNSLLIGAAVVEALDELGALNHSEDLLKWL